MVTTKPAVAYGVRFLLLQVGAPPVGSGEGPFCAGDGLDPNVTTPCPCGNFGSVGGGCGNSLNLSAVISRTPGSLTTSGMTGSVSLLFQGDALDDTPYGDGVRCVGGNLRRIGLNMFLPGSPTGGMSIANDSVIMARGLVTTGSGAVRYYQTFYRNAAAAFCPPGTFNVSSGYVIIW